MQSGAEPLEPRMPTRSAAAPAAAAPRALSRGVVAIALMLSALHLLNFLNYTFIRDYFNPPVARSALLVACALGLLVTSASNLRFHFSRGWDAYAICLLALLSVTYSLRPDYSLKYAAWLLLSVYVGTELAARVRHPRDVVAVLAIVLLPSSFLVAIVNLAIGPTVTSSGRYFGALGSHHVDTAYAMNFICLFLALRALPVAVPPLPRWLRLALWAVLAWALYQSLFGLTRSVWLGVLMAAGLYYFRQRFSFGRLAGVLAMALVVAMVFQSFGAERILPQGVQDRLELTEQRIESGEVDPRVEGMVYALQHSLEYPFGSGYATLSSHNSYLNMLLYIGWPGFLLALFAVVRSGGLVVRRGLPWTMFFAIGAAPLLLHAFFEVQSTPGQGNFVPLLVWYALARAPFDGASGVVAAAAPGWRPRFVAP